MITPIDLVPADAKWRTVPVNDNYEVSNYGHVRRRVSGAGPHTRYPALTPVIPRMKRNGYYGVALWRDGKAKSYNVHRLVALAFIPNPDNLPVAAHRDDVKVNCFEENLKWATFKDNTADSLRNGRHPIGTRSAKAKLAPDQVAAIRIAPGKQRDIAKQYNISQGAVWHIKHGTNWKHIPLTEEQRLHREQTRRKTGADVPCVRGHTKVPGWDGKLICRACRNIAQNNRRLVRLGRDPAQHHHGQHAVGEAAFEAAHKISMRKIADALWAKSPHRRKESA